MYWCLFVLPRFVTRADCIEDRLARGACIWIGIAGISRVAGLSEGEIGIGIAGVSHVWQEQDGVRVSLCTYWWFSLQAPQ